MSSPAARSVAPTSLRHFGAGLRIAFAGSSVWLEGCAPTSAAPGMTAERFTISGAVNAEQTLAAISAFRPDITVIFDPPSVGVDVLRDAPGVTLGVLVDGAPDEADAPGLDRLDRMVSFTPSLTGTRIGRNEVWRAIPPPVSDIFFDAVRTLSHSPRVMSIGAASAHREATLMPAKHHYDLLQVIHGVSGDSLRELLGEYDVGVFLAPDPGGGFGLQVGMHLAAGHLLLADGLTPSHGLERNIDYLHLDSADGLVWILERLRRFPRMHHRVRVRGRLKAEQYRSSRLFARIAGDLLADVAAFGVSASSAG